MACVRRRRGRWVADFRDSRGRRHWETYPTKKKAEDALADVQVGIKGGTYCDPAMLPTFEKVGADWLAVKQDHPASSVQFWTTQVERHFLPAFGHLRIDQVMARDIERFRNAKRDGTDGHERLQRSTINQLLQTLAAILEYAVAHKYLPGNPAKQVERVKAKRRAGVAGQAVDPQEVLTAEQAGAVIEAADPGLYRTFITTALHTGARVGELLALSWEHLDLEGGTMRIERSLSWVRGKERGYGKATPLFGPPKTDSSYRTLDLAPDLVHELKAWRLRSPYSREEDLLFPNSLGKPLHRAFLHKGLQLAIGKASRAGTTLLPHVSVHGLRHTFASLMIQLGKPVSQVSQILGHKNPDLTLKVYTHWFKGASSASAMADLAAAIRQPAAAGGSKMVADTAAAERTATK